MGWFHQVILLASSNPNPVTTILPGTASISTTGLLGQYGPILVAMAGLITAVVAALSRRDRKRTDSDAALDARTNTAIRGLTEAYDRLEMERAREERGRIEAEHELTQAQEKIAELELEIKGHRQRRKANGNGT